MPSSFPTTEWQKFLATPWINWCQWRGNLASWDLDNIETTVWVCLSDVFVAIKSHVFWAELAIAVDGLQQLFEQGIDMRQYWSPWMCIDVHTEQRDADTTCTCPYIYIYTCIYIYIYLYVSYCNPLTHLQRQPKETTCRLCKAKAHKLPPFLQQLPGWGICRSTRTSCGICWARSLVEAMKWMGVGKTSTLSGVVR